ncbi:12317_t:CDS:1, partial [Gigaspora margarita]
KNQNEKEVDNRIKLALQLGDPKIITDLCEHNPGALIHYEVFEK